MKRLSVPQIVLMHSVLIKETGSMDGEVVWRCANRVEHGKEICKHSPTLSETAVKNFLCKALNVDEYDPQAVRESIEAILVNSNPN